jgi:hypothetical protein
MERETPLVHVTAAAAAGNSSIKRRTYQLYIFKVWRCLHVQIHYGLSKLDFRLIKGKNRIHSIILLINLKTIDFPKELDNVLIIKS